MVVFVYIHFYSHVDYHLIPLHLDIVLHSTCEQTRCGFNGLPYSMLINEKYPIHRSLYLEIPLLLPFTLFILVFSLFISSVGRRFLFFFDTELKDNTKWLLGMVVVSEIHILTLYFGRCELWFPWGCWSISVHVHAESNSFRT